MSRIGKQPITVPAGVTVTIDGTTVTVKGAKTVKYALKSLKSKKTYYVRIRAYKKVSGKTYYSGWTKGKVKTKK